MVCDSGNKVSEIRFTRPRPKTGAHEKINVNRIAEQIAEVIRRDFDNESCRRDICDGTSGLPESLKLIAFPGTGIKHMKEYSLQQAIN